MKYEYASLLVVSAATLADLNRYGQDEWELVSVHTDSIINGKHYIRYTFKRGIRDGFRESGI